jgi:hypothetical protein
MRQMKGRIWRQPQDKETNCIQLISGGSVEALMNQVASTKDVLLDQLTNVCGNTGVILFCVPSDQILTFYSYLKC